MPFRAWLFIVAFGLAFSATNAWSQERPNPTLERQPEPESGQAEGNDASSESAAPEEQRAFDFTPALRDIEAAIRDLIPQEDDTTSQRQKDRDIADLKAQQEMALWAKRMFWATFASVLATLIGIYLIWRTLYHTGRAANYAKDMVDQAKHATDAANATVAATREIAHIEMAAFLTFDSGFYTANDDSFWFEIWIKNVGRTLAKQIKAVATISISETLTTTNGVSVTHLIVKDERRPIPIFPENRGVVRFGVSRMSHNREFRAIADKKNRFNVWLKVEWTDSFKERHEVGFMMSPQSYRVEMPKNAGALEIGASYDIDNPHDDY